MGLRPHPAQRLRERPAEPSRANPTPLTSGEEQTLAQRPPLLVCAACRAPITQPSAAIEVNGSHAHTFLNPAGMVYRIRCFASAPGALGLGEESEHWTWFPGFRWQACICRACFEHLGWRFAGGGAVFFGLIHERVVEQGGGAPS